MHLNALCKGPLLWRPITKTSAAALPAALKQTLLIMKFTAILLLAFCLQAGAKGYSQITLREKNAPLHKVFAAIKQQSGYDFLYPETVIEQAGKITITVTNVSLETALQAVLNDKGLGYVIVENTIIIRRREEPPLPPAPVEKPLTVTVGGRVSNEAGEPVAGVSVTVKGTTQGTVSNAKGEYSLPNVNEQATLVFTSINIEPVELKVNGRNLINVTVKIKVSPLDEIQVIAYGTKSKRLQTGNVTTIKAADIEKQPVNNPLYALQGRVPGLQITPSSGLPGAPVTIQIRGNNSYNFRTEPLVLVNGIPLSNNIPGLGSSAFNSTSGTNIISALNFINPNDIESVEVLKDADATSIYGSRGANGVILITTKKGNVGRMTVDINIQKGYSAVSKTVNMLNSEQYIQMRKDGYSNSNVNLLTVAPDIGNADVTLWDRNNYTNWQEVLIGGVGSVDNISAEISGGNQSIRYFFGGTFLRETTVFPSENADRKASGHLSVTGISQNQKLRSTIRVSYMSDQNSLPFNDLTKDAITLAPNAPSLYTSFGTLNWEPLPSGGISWTNPLYNLHAYAATINNLSADLDIHYTVLSNFTVKLLFGYNELNGTGIRTQYPFEGRPQSEINNPAYTTFNTNGSKNINFEPHATYSAKIAGGKMEFLFGSSLQTMNTTSQQIEAEGYTSDALSRNLGAATGFPLAINSSSEYRYAALYGRINYNYHNKYILNFNVRRDGSSRFGSGRQFGEFGSVGGAWIFSEEKFIKSTLSFIS
jgi:TonB-dependent starch-binding outer membrane protein SusC